MLQCFKRTYSDNYNNSNILWQYYNTATTSCDTTITIAFIINDDDDDKDDYNNGNVSTVQGSLAR